MTAVAKAVFLDRDGVINKTLFRRGAQRAPQDMSEWEWMEGVHETLLVLRERGYLLFVVTNQPDVSRGWQERSQVDEFHALIEQELPVEEVFACFHDNADDCECRKPKPGMLLAAGEPHGVDYAASFMVGDRQGDIEAGKAAGCRTIYFRHPESKAADGADFEVRALRDLLDIIR